jgi:hypothetical protein
MGSDNKRPASDNGYALLPANLSVTGEQAAIGSRQLDRTEEGATYAAVFAGDFTPQQPSGLLKPTAMDSDPSESPVSKWTANRRISSEIPGPLSGKPDVTTPNAQVANTCLPAGLRPNKTPIFISGYCGVRAFLDRLRQSCRGDLTAQLKGENLMVVPSTADRFGAAIRSLRSLNGKVGVRFHTFTHSEDCCVRLLVKKLGRVMPESVVR